MNENYNEISFRNSGDVESYSENSHIKLNPNKIANKNSKNLFWILVTSFIEKSLTIILIFIYSHLHSFDNFITLCLEISAYLLIIFEFSPQKKWFDQINPQEISRINSDILPKKSKISQISAISDSSKISRPQLTLEDPLLEKNSKKEIDFFCRQIVFCFLPFIICLSFVIKLGYLIVLLLDESVEQWQANHLSLVDFLNIHIEYHKNNKVFALLREFLPDFIMLILVILISIWQIKKKPGFCKDNVILFDLDYKKWKIRFQYVIISCLILCPFLAFNLFGMVFICFAIIFMLSKIKNIFIEQTVFLLRFYIIAFLILGHLTNVPLIINEEIFNGFRRKMMFYGNDLLVNFFTNAYSFSLCMLLIFLLLMVCIYTKILSILKEKKKLKSQEPILSFSKNTKKEINSFISVNSQEEKDLFSEEEHSFKNKAVKFLVSSFYAFLNFFQSLETILRALQLYSIIIIMRYETIYPLGCIFWIFISGVTLDHHLLSNLSAIVVLPLISMEILMMYYTNIPTNSDIPENGKIFGFEKFAFEGFEYLFLMGYLTLHIIYFAQFRNLLKNSLKIPSRKSKISSLRTTLKSTFKKVSFIKILKTFIYKNSYFLTLFILFWISLYTVNLMHLILALFFVAFFIKTGTNSLIVKNPQVPKEKKIVTTFQQKYWIYLVVYIDLVILIRHIWTLLIVRYFNSQLDIEYIDFIGLNYSYELNYANLGFRDVDFASNTINWILFIFVVLQNDTYKSKIFKAAPNMMNLLKDYQPIEGCFYTCINNIVRWVYIIYYKSIIWVGYLVMISLLIFEPIDLINTIMLFFVLMVFLWHIFKIYNKNLNTKRLYHFWIFLTFLIITVNVLRYVFQFFRFQLLQKLLGPTQIDDFLTIYGSVLGLFFYEPLCKNPENCQIYPNKLRFGFLYNIILLFVSILGYHYLSLIQYYLRISKSIDNFNDDSRDLENPNERRRSSLESENGREVGYNEYMKTIKEFFEEYVNVSLVKEIKGLDSFLYYASLFYISIMFFFLMLFCIYFWLSLANFIYFLLYLYYFNKVHSSFIEFTCQSNLYIRIKEKMRIFKKNFLSYEALTDHNFIPEHDYNRQDFLNDINIVKIQCLTAKVYYKKVLWKKTILFSVFCLFLTFLSQWCVIPNVPKNHTFVQYLMWGLFLFGTYSCDETSLFRNIYPYFIFVILNFIEMKSILYLDEMIDQQIKSLNLSLIKTKDNIMLPVKTLSESSFGHKKSDLLEESKTAENNENNGTQTILFKSHHFFQNQARSIKHDAAMFTLYFFEKIYLIIFLINSDINYNLFSMITFITIAYLSITRYYPTAVIRVLNNCTLLLLFFRYSLFLINNNQNTNPKTIPSDLQQLMSFNLVDFIFENSDFSQNMIRYCKQYLALGEKNYDFVSFFMNSLIIYIVQFYFLWMLFIFRFIYSCIEKQTNKLEENFKWDLLIEYKKYKGSGLKILATLHSFVFVNLHYIICFLMSFFVISNASIYNFILFTFIMLFLIIDESFLFHMNFKKHHKVIRIIMRIIMVYLIFLLLSTQVSHMPVFMEKCIEDYACQTIFSMSVWDKLSGIILIKFCLDLLNDESYVQIASSYLLRQNFRAQALRTCISYDVNDAKMKKWLEKLEDKLILKQHIRFVVQKLEYWHAKYFSTEPKLKMSSEKLSENELKIDQKSEEMQPNINDTKKVKINWRLKIFNFLQEKKDKFIFMNVLNLVNYIIMKNCNIISAQVFEMTDYMFIRFSKLEKTLSYIQHFHRRFIKALKLRLQNKETVENLNFSEENLEKFFFLLYDEIKDSLYSEYPKDHTHSNESGKLLVKQVSSEGFLDLNLLEDRRLEEGKNPSIFLLIIIAGEVIISHWHIVCNIFIIFYIFWNTGLICFLLPLYVFGFLLIEEKSAKVSSWLLLMAFFLLISISKLCIRTLQINENNETMSKLMIVFGEHVFSLSYEFFMLIILSVEINLLRRKGLDKTGVVEAENIYQAFFRKKLNNDFEDIKKNNEIIEEMVQDQKDEEKDFHKEEELSPDKKMSFENGGFYLQIMDEAEKRTFQRRKTSFSRRFLENTKQCNYDTLKWDAIKDLEREVLSSILSCKLKSFKDLFFRFFSTHNRKNGKDLYKYILIIQIIIAFYIFFLFSKMLEVDDTSIADSVKYSTFSGTMVLALFFHFSVMFIERLIMLYNPFKNEKNEKIKASISLFSFENQMNYKQIGKVKSENMYKTQIFMKYVLHFFLLLMIPYFVLVFIPTQGSNKIKDNKLNLNKYDIVFFLYYNWYFYISSLEIKYGFFDHNKLNSLKRGYSQFQGFMFRVYKIIPFLYEFKTFMDWYFTETSLSLVKWIKLEEIKGKLFLAKCSSVKFKQRNHGNKVKWWIKFFMGGCGLFLLVLCIFGPMLLFSTLNPIAETNLVSQISLKIGLLSNNNKYFRLYSADSIMDVAIVNNSQYDEAGFNRIPFFKSFDRNELQIINMQTFSDDLWAISDPNLDLLKQILQDSISQQGINSIDVVFEYSIKRQRETSLIGNSLRTSFQNISLMSEFLNSLSVCQEKTVLYFPKFMKNTIKISSKSEILTIDYNDILTKDLYVSMICNNNSNARYWSLSANQNGTQSLKLYTISNASTSNILGYSIIGFYIGVVYIIGKLLRNAISNKAVSFLFTELPDPDNLIRLCEVIRIARQEKNHYMEEVFYYELMDLLKSPDVVKQITGSSVQKIKEKEKKKIA